jgi:putative isomerase
MAANLLISKTSEKTIIYFLFFWLAFILNGCQETDQSETIHSIEFSKNILDYRLTPRDSLDKSALMFSDQGAWFAYSLADSTSNGAGFSGPFLLTQNNGIWSSKSLATLTLKGEDNTNSIDWSTALRSRNSYASHLSQNYKNEILSVTEDLVFLSGNTALQKTVIKNISNEEIKLNPSIGANLFDVGISISSSKNTVVLNSKNSTAIGHIKFLNESASIKTDTLNYNALLEGILLKPNETKEYIISQSFIFPEYSWETEKSLIEKSNFDAVMKIRKTEKEDQLQELFRNRKEPFSMDQYSEVLAKAHLTLQNNWRLPAGEIKHEGLFPSYHYKWFNGFWAWDSWKHAVGLSFFNPALAKEQVKLMFDFQKEDGFVADCVFRDTLIEKHNYRDTKPPLASWAVAKIYEKDKDLKFLKDLYPKLKKYHYWWYQKRDHDSDGLCEYGSTDGSVVAAKWESGMDNAIRFDNSKILKNTEGAYSLNQESVDLNAYLYAEKIFLYSIATELEYPAEAVKWKEEAEELKVIIQLQFFDKEDGWFYDTTLDGNTFIKGKGSEGWTPLWAKVATEDQAVAVKNKMMDPSKFFTKVPFQTMSADHEKFNPLKGYWRGPNWLDQAYFGVKGLRNYGFEEEANKATKQLFIGAKGLLGKGRAIRENYHPLSGEGLNAHNFSWSAAHIIMLLMQD